MKTQISLTLRFRFEAKDSKLVKVNLPLGIHSRDNALTALSLLLVYKGMIVLSKSKRLYYA